MFKTCNLPRKGIGIALVVALGSGACTTKQTDSQSASGPPETPNFDQGGSAGQDPATEPDLATDLPDALNFDSNDTVRVTPTSVTQLDLQATPPGTYLVQFALVGQSLDAALDVGESTTDEDGYASVELTAPSKPTTFAVRASVGSSVSDEIEISTSSDGFGTLHVGFDYGGRRKANQWRANLFTSSSCDQLAQAAGDGAGILQASSQNDQPVTLTDVPAGTALSVTLLGDEVLNGCADLEPLAVDEERDVSVEVSDLPALLSEVSLPMAFGATQGPRPLADGVGDSLDHLLSAFVGRPDGDVSGVHDLVALLDEMQAIASDDIATEFESRRSSAGWDALVTQPVDGTDRSSLLRDTVRDWVESGVDQLTLPDVFRLTMNLAPAQSSSPNILVDSLLGHDPKACGIQNVASLSRKVEADDRLAWSTTLGWAQGELLNCLALDSVQKDQPDAESVEAGLDLQLSCASFAAELDPVTSTSRLCGTACLTSLCQDALASMWKRGIDAATADLTTTLAVNGAGTFTVDSKARPDSTEGTWVGLLTTPITTVTVNGTFNPP